MTRQRRQREQAGSGGVAEVPSSVPPGENRDELSYLRTLVSIERVLRGLVDQVFRLSCELLGQLLLESRQRILDRLS